MFLLLALLTVAIRAGGAADAPPEQLQLVGKHVDLELKSGKTLHGVVIEEAVAGKIAGTIAKLRVSNPATETRPTLVAAAIKRVTEVNGAELLVFDDVTKSLVPPDEETRAAIHAAATAAKANRSGNGSKTSKGRSSRSNNNGQESSADAAAHYKSSEEKRIQFFKRTGVWLWPDLTADQQETAIKAQQAYVRKVSERFSSLNMQLHETQYFLFLSDLPPKAALAVTACLDTMYAQLCKAFAIKQHEQVWLGGKLPVIAFSRPEHFSAFEKEFFKNGAELQNVQGIAHQQSNGIVVVSCRCGNDPYYFAGVLVHETTHGFVHRYKSAQRVPSWLNEGIAEWVAMNVVTRDQGIRRRVQDSLVRTRQSGNLGGDFFTCEHLATGQKTQYGIATAMIDYMLRSNPKGFRTLIEDIKLGVKWQKALQKSYRVTPEQLAQQFGEAVVGIPNLTP
ncbi:MAG: basic secretory protein-like protein [Thermoguttaceae bacterium]